MHDFFLVPVCDTKIETKTTVYKRTGGLFSSVIAILFGTSVVIETTVTSEIKIGDQLCDSLLLEELEEICQEIH